MILTDAGPLIALIDRGEPDHRRCSDALSSLPTPMVTTWPAFTEAIYLLGRTAGWQGQRPLWQTVRLGSLVIADADTPLTLRAAELMESYEDHPMDLADATLVALAESLGLRRIFTLDQHFRAYRLRGGHHLDIVP